MRKAWGILVFLILDCTVYAPVPEWPIPKIGDSVETILQWIAENISYETDIDQYGVTGYWATPMETYSLGAGDCEDFCTLALYLIHRDAGIDGTHVIGVNSAGDIHGWIRIDGVDWEPSTARLVDPVLFQEVATLTYAESMATIGRSTGVLLAGDNSEQRYTRIENANPDE